MARNAHRCSFERLAALFVSRNFFPAEKKVRSRIVADYEPGDDTFVRTMGNVLGPPLLEGNEVTLLQNGDEIFPAMLSAIRSAERTITFENFLLSEGEVSDAFAEALAERARARGEGSFPPGRHGLQSSAGARHLSFEKLRRAGRNLPLRSFHEREFPDTSKDFGPRRQAWIPGWRWHFG
jgi:hypothetical protein